MSLAQHRTRRTVGRVFKHYNDILPQPSPSLPPSAAIEPLTPSPPGFLKSRLLRIFQSPRNIFGLRRKYYAIDLPSHDPEELVTLRDLYTTQRSTPDTQDIYFPYPNKNSFLLGDWYWNEGEQKSQQSFKDLMKIVGNPNFDPFDVQGTKWASINDLLGSSEQDEARAGEWMDSDAGWVKTPIKMSVPFHAGTSHPGVQTYTGGELYHRSILEVIKERLSDIQVAQHFHLEPYKLTWAPHPTSYEIPVYGELYTSPSFIDAHRKLQDSPGEPECNLQRVVVALMFWSDATHLTSFGNAKLWPLYLFFGNESKYRRCKPTYNLCCHIAYFQDVSENGTRGGFITEPITIIDFR